MRLKNLISNLLSAGLWNLINCSKTICCKKMYRPWRGIDLTSMWMFFHNSRMNTVLELQVFKMRFVHGYRKWFIKFLKHFELYNTSSVWINCTCRSCTSQENQMNESSCFIFCFMRSHLYNQINDHLSLIWLWDWNAVYSQTKVLYDFIMFQKIIRNCVKNPSTNGMKTFTG